MAKYILIDDNGTTTTHEMEEVLSKSHSPVGHEFLMKALAGIDQSQRGAILECIKNDAVTEYFLDKLYCCDCGSVVQMCTVINHNGRVCCQACDDSPGTERYHKLTRKYGRQIVHEYFMQQDAEAESDSSTGDIIESLTHYYLHGVNSDPIVIAADIKNNLNELDAEDWAGQLKLIAEALKK